MSTRALARITTLSLFAVALTLLIVLSSGTAHAAGSFNPVGSVCLNDQTTVDPDPLRPGHAGECDGSNAAGAKVAITSSFGVGLGPDGLSQQGAGDDTPDYNFGFNVSFTPPEWGVAKGTDIPIGAIVGTLNSDATLGLLGNPCRSPVLVPFTFLNASTNPAVTILPKEEGEKDRLSPLNADANANNIPDGADKWPSYLNDIDAFKNVNPADIRARMFGVNATSVAGLTIVLNFIIFEPGADLSDVEGKVLDIDPRLGYISVTVLQDPTAAASSSDPVNDFCSPLLSSTTIFGVTEKNPNTGTGGDKAYRTNPPEGAYSYIAASQPQRDADGDGIENGLDPCPLTPDPNWDPRTQSPTGHLADSDWDADGLPSSCDPDDKVPSPTIGSIFDEDRDQWMNRSDNCPLVKNGPQEKDIPGVGNNTDSDKDGIGDACDPHPNDADAEGDPEAFAACVVHVLKIGAGGTPPIAAGTYQPCTLEGLSAMLPADGGGPTPTPTPAPGDGQQTEEEQQALARQKVLESLAVGMNISAADESVPVGGSTPIVATCAEVQNSLQAISGADITFKIKEQPGSDANLDGKTEVTKTSDAEGFAETTLNVGSTVGEIVVSAEGCGTKTVTVTVTGEALGEVTGPDGGAATGVGSLAPVASSIPAWAAIASALGGAGLLGALGTFLARFVRRRRY